MQALITPPSPLATQRLDTGGAIQRLHRQQQIQQDIAGQAQAKYHGGAQRIPIGSLGGVHSHGAAARTERAALRVARSATADKRFNCAFDVTKLDR
ncbi:hypothetical protein RPPX_13245 [Pseudomonas putida S12]|uniref:Uncharacterized protein n=1 Tax=Pseudomonas putida S12 TaxID=1215087 RepID=A0AA34WRT1_PSEPU|nr:hypothetical protein RPPX_13245 [Pseudomonas putida S12]